MDLAAAARDVGTARRSRWWVVGVGVLIAVLALAVRWPGHTTLTPDVRYFFAPWYDVISQNGGFAALRHPFYNYNPPYPYLLVLATALPLPELLAIKLIPVVFDLVLGFAGFLLVRWFTRSDARALLAAAVLVLAPTVVLNGAWWGQCESIWASFGLLAIYQQLRRRTVLAWVLLAVGMGFKLQAVFVLPVLVTVLMCYRVRLRTAAVAVAASVGTFVVLLLPAALAGASWSTLLGIYPAQVTGTNGIASRTLRDLLADPSMPYASGGIGPTGPSPTGALNYGAANVYQWLPANGGRSVFVVGLIVTAAVVGGAALLAYRRRAWLGPRTLLVVAAFQSSAIPLLLPGMHSRYFYLADALLIAAACVLPRLIPAAVLAQLASLSAYAVYLWGAPAWLLDLGAAAALAALLLIGRVGATMLGAGDAQHRRAALGSVHADLP